MPKTKDQIIADILGHVAKDGGLCSRWYAGITKDAPKRLFNDHSVRQGGDWWIYREAYTSTSAREIEDYLVNTCGLDGGSGGGDRNSTFVYAYKKAPHTNP